MSMVLYYWMSKGEHLVCYWVDLSIPSAWWDFCFCCLSCLLSSGHSLFPEPGGMSLAGVIKNRVTGDGHNRSLGRTRQCTRAARQGVEQTGAVYYWTGSKQNIPVSSVPHHGLHYSGLWEWLLLLECKRRWKKKLSFWKTQSLQFKEGFRSFLILFPLLGRI